MGNCVSKPSSSIQCRLLPAVILILLSAPLLATADDPYSWDDCRDRVNAIRNGSLTWDGISQKNLEHFIYHGIVRGLDGSYPRDRYLLLTYDGCRRICGESHIAYNKPTNILNILATWVFPLAIALGLPFESYHRKRVRRTLTAILSWLGSPQTALTSAIDNFRQTRECYRRTKAASTGRTWENSYYILSCLNQFQVNIRGRGEGVNNNNKAGPGPEEAGIADQLIDEEIFLQTLVYGLFRPLSNVSAAGVDATHARVPPPTNSHGLPAGAIPLQNLNGAPTQTGPGPARRLSNQQPASLREIEKAEIQLTTELLSALAFQLRMHRRRGVVPTLASLGTFLMAFIFSCVLAFGDLSDSTTIFVLDLGIFFSWLPVLVIFAIVDRNPVSSERQATLMSRWLYNVNEVRKWSESARNSVLNPAPAGPAAPGAQPIHLVQNTHRGPAPQPPLTVVDAARQVGWWSPSQANDDLGAFQIGSFIGQGRSLEYCGLAAATLACTKTRGCFSKWTSQTPRDLARDIASRLRGCRPVSWYITAFICLFIVWVEVGLATMADYITPTVGLGCWSLIFLGYGFFSSISWFIQFFTMPSGSQGWLKRMVMTWVSLVFNAIAVLWIVLIIILLASGMLNNCFCNSCMPGFTGAGGYTDLESSFAFYRDNYGLTKPWTIAAAVGASVPAIALIVALFWWRGCSHLWAASEQGVEQSERDRRPVMIDMRWLGE